MVAEIPHEGTVTFKSLTVGMTDRIAIVVRFLAVLELFKQGLVEIDQVDTFGDIHVSWLTGADLADIDLIDVYEG
jgi:segregation and condensation protein A